MAKKIRLTKNELRKQKEALKRFQEFLPTLQLKKQQLQVELGNLRQKKEELQSEKDRLLKEVDRWIAVFAEEVGLEDLLQLERIETETGNIAGVDMPVFKKVVFQEKEYDLFDTPLWVDDGLEAVKEAISANARLEIFKKQEEALQEELRTTSQRVNLFEKVMIPETKGNIKKIQIYLGDQQTAHVVTGKIAKKKIEQRKVSV